MTYECDYSYHVRRARAELDLAYRADAYPAMAAHLQMASLHLNRVRSSRDAVPDVPSALMVLSHMR